ncbi:glycoside hydrolase family 18 protein [bacterium]|nr:glycoside hydrolase family 18 protein [bacterium]
MLVALLLLSACAQPRPAPAGSSGFPGPPRLVGYLPEYRLKSADPALLGKYYSDIILYSVDVTKSGGLDTGRLDKRGWKLAGRLREAGVQRIYACIGGGLRSKHFNAATNDRPSRARLVGELVSLCQTRGLDGVDFDWEFPSTAQQRRQYDALIRETAAAFAPHGLKLSAAVIGRQQLSPESIAALDCLHLMAYDGPGRHSTFDFAAGAVSGLLARGVPAQKLCLGVPFYARGVKRHGRALPYSHLAARNWLAPDEDQLGDMYYNGPGTLQRKTEYALKSGLGGIMVWEIGQDAPDCKLARVISRAMKSKPESGQP